MAFESSTTKSKNISQDDNSLYEVGNEEIENNVPLLNPMVFYPAFPHIVERIFDQLDRGSLGSCREVSKSW